MDACNRELELIGEYPITATNTIREDLEQIMANYPDAKIISRRVGRHLYYSYETENYSIYKIPLNDDEFAQITQTLSILSRFEGMPQFEWLDEIKSALNIKISSDPIVGFDENIDLKGRDYFAQLFSAINNKQPLVLTYKNFKRNINQQFIVHPYYLKQFNRRWFLIGFSENIGRLSLFAFDRIEDITTSNCKYIPNTKYNFKDYFDDMIGVTRIDHTDIETVRIWVSANRWPYVATKPLHGTQRIISKDVSGVIIQIQVYINKELEQLILSFGKDFKVLEPESLKQTIAQQFCEALKNYQ
ncbi:MAG: helix-turn-helix transcriptional regulator [Alistipes shahii]|uniref:helix-turn-helix transcriptional regulator n=1 Tax=Alistipes shahii TaxID=328814 RepID=UPI00210A63F6|nr:WYL domain-containing protein [Alistipes shahii]MCQ5075502.1 WYL domain-containing protein [Alistipes shahii]